MERGREGSTLFGGEKERREGVAKALPRRKEEQGRRETGCGEEERGRRSSVARRTPRRGVTRSGG
eukprot:2389574-Rhodomonas_salina.1